MATDPLEIPTSQLDDSNPAVLIAEAQLLLADKRTSLATVRTCIALFALPLTILSALIATSGFYEATQVLHLLIPVVVVCLFLLTMAVYLNFRAVNRIRRLDALLQRLRAKDPRLAELLS